MFCIPSEVFKKFQLIQGRVEKIGKGSFGEVFLVKGVNGVDYALKVSEEPDSNKKGRLFACAQRVNGTIEYLIQHFDKTTVGNNVFVKMDYANSGSLTDIFNKDDSHSGMRRGAINFMYQILLGVETLHMHKIAHRDLKPDNILLHKVQGQPVIIKITDFGLSRPLEDSKNLEMTRVGTLKYMAPEIVQGPLTKKTAVYDNKIDVWSMGILFYQIITDGRLPWGDTSGMSHADFVKVVMTPIPRPPELNPPSSCKDASNRLHRGLIVEEDALDNMWGMIHGMTQIDPSKRTSLHDLLNNQLFGRSGQPTETATEPLHQNSHGGIKRPRPSLSPSPPLPPCANTGANTLMPNITTLPMEQHKQQQQQQQQGVDPSYAIRPYQPHNINICGVRLREAIPTSFRLNPKGGFTAYPIPSRPGQLGCVFASGDIAALHTVFLEHVITRGVFRWSVHISYAGNADSSKFCMGCAPWGMAGRFDDKILGIEDVGSCSFAFWKQKNRFASALYGVGNRVEDLSDQVYVPDGSSLTLEIDANAHTVSFFKLNGGYRSKYNDSSKYPFIITSVPSPLCLGISGNNGSFTSEAFFRIDAPTMSLAQCTSYECMVKK